MDDYKSENRETYDRYAKEFDTKFGKHFDERVRKDANLFLSQLTGKKILDAGSGPGNHAEYFKQNGCDVTCIDISPEMVKLCLAKGLKAVVDDLENLHIDGSFDGIWAYASLLHVPKDKVRQALKSLTAHLKPHGLIGIALKEGRGEGFETHDKYPGTKRWFTYFTDKEVKDLFAGDFELLHESKDNVKNKYVFIDYIFRLKS